MLKLVQVLHAASFDRIPGFVQRQKKHVLHVLNGIKSQWHGAKAIFSTMKEHGEVHKMPQDIRIQTVEVI